MEWQYDDGGRAAAGYKGVTGDCFCRAVAIAAERPYQEVYDLINECAKNEKTGKRKKGVSNARTGTYKYTERKVMAHYGFEWVPAMQIGSGCQKHLCANELPKGRIVCLCSKHMVAVVDGVLHDTYDSSRGETRCVYGYYIKKENKMNEIYISGFVATQIGVAKNKGDEAEDAINTIAEYLFDGNIEEAAGLVEFCKDDKMQPLLEEIEFWDSPAKSIVGEEMAYKLALPLLEEYAEKTGYVIRWKAFCEKLNLPIPEYDREVPEIIRDEKVILAQIKLNGGGTGVLYLPLKTIPDGLKLGHAIEINLAGAKFAGEVENVEEVGGHLCSIVHNKK